MFITSLFFCEPFEEMSFNLQSFVGEPRMEEFNSLKRRSCCKLPNISI